MKTVNSGAFVSLLKIHGHIYYWAMLCGMNCNRRNLTTVCLHLPYKGGVGK